MTHKRQFKDLDKTKPQYVILHNTKERIERNFAFPADIVGKVSEINYEGNNWEIHHDWYRIVYQEDVFKILSKEKDPEYFL